MRNGKDRVFASPLARRLAGERGLDLGALQLGPRGRIIKRDVERRDRATSSLEEAGRSRR